MNYWIFTTPRSGSNYLAGEIRRRLGGQPKSSEFFNPVSLRTFADFVPDRDAPVTSFLRYLHARHEIRGVLGIKMLWVQIELCCRYPDFLPAVAGSGIVYLRRRDVIRQGISLYFAEQTGSWISGKQPTRLGPMEVEYDHAAIEQKVARMERFNSLLQRFLHVHRLDHLTVWYEDFVADNDGEAGRILAHLGLEAFDGPLSDRRPFEVQATRRNDEFYERFLEDERLRLRGDGAYRGPPLFPEATSDDASQAAGVSREDRGPAVRDTDR